MRRLEYGGKLIARRLASAPAALLFGSEKFGLSNEEMSYCHWLMRIPTREEHGSMNLGQAVAVCLYEMIRDPKATALKPEPQRPWPMAKTWSGSQGFWTRLCRSRDTFTRLPKDQRN